jgi:hypothetical protein
MLLKNDLRGPSEQLQKTRSHTQHRFEQPFAWIRLLRAPCSSPSFSTASTQQSSRRCGSRYAEAWWVRGISFHVFGFGGDIRRYELPQRFMALTPRLPA